MYDLVFIVSTFDLIENPNDFEVLRKSLNLNIDPEWPEEGYDDAECEQGDTYLFQSHDDCLFLDLFNRPTDQNETISAGTCCKRELHVRIEIVATSIYGKTLVKGVQADKGISIPDELINSNNHPIERPTIMAVNGKKTYCFL